MADPSPTSWYDYLMDAGLTELAEKVRRPLRDQELVDLVKDEDLGYRTIDVLDVIVGIVEGGMDDEARERLDALRSAWEAAQSHAGDPLFLAHDLAVLSRPRRWMTVEEFQARAGLD